MNNYLTEKSQKINTENKTHLFKLSANLNIK